MSGRVVVFVAGLVWMVGWACAGAGDVRVELRVAVPAGTDPRARLFVAGNAAALGGWRADGLELKRGEGGVYRASFAVPRGAGVEFKITGGTWETVEKGMGGEEVGNHRFVAEGEGMKVEVTVASWARPPGAKVVAASRPSTRVGDVRVHEGFRAEGLGNRRRIWVYLPPGYEGSSERYPVLYMQDGQNLFDEATSFAGEWRVDESAEELIKAGRVRPVIIVGVENTAGRMEEYTPTRDERVGAGGKAEGYANFLVNEVKPFIDRTYRTLPDRGHTAVAGSSLGGLVSLYLLKEGRGVFSMGGVMSPSLWWDGRRLLKEVEGDGAFLRGDKVWVDVGTAEGAEVGKVVADARELVGAMEKEGMERGREFEYVEAEGAGHNEAAWAKRFPKMLEFFFPAEKKQQ